MEEHQIEKALEEELIEESEEKTSDGDSNEEKTSFFSEAMEIIESIITSMLVVLLLFAFVCRPVTVEGDSMNPTLEDQDKLLMMTFMCTPESGDVVIVDNKMGYIYKLDGSKELIANPGITPNVGETSKKIIKRVIAVGGQTIDIRPIEGTKYTDVYVDGKLLNETYIKEKIKVTNTGAFEYPVTVPEGYVFVMGDNRNNSTDSRAPQVGFVKEEDIVGEALFRFQPFENFKIIE